MRVCASGPRYRLGTDTGHGARTESAVRAAERPVRWARSRTCGALGPGRHRPDRRKTTRRAPRSGQTNWKDRLVARIGDGGDLLKCSFCGKSQKQVKKLIAGPGVYICDECIDLCNEIIEEE